MEVIVQGRQIGKTFKLIKLCAENGGYIVCFSRNEVQRVFRQAKVMNLVIPLPITFEEFKCRQYMSNNISHFYIDNLDMCIQQISNVPIEAVTLSG